MKDSFPLDFWSLFITSVEHRFLIVAIAASPSPPSQYYLRYSYRQSLVFTIVAIGYRLPFVPELYRYHGLMCLYHECRGHSLAFATVTITCLDRV